MTMNDNDTVAESSPLASLVRNRGEAAALVEHGRTWSYHELDAAVDRLATEMHGDLPPGERVALMLPNGVELVVCYLACFRSGAVATPLNNRYAAPEVEAALRRSRPRWLMVASGRRALLDQLDPEVLDGIRVIAVDGVDSLSGDARVAPAGGLPAVVADAPAVIFFTSGSTGRPKGVVHTHASAYAMLTSTSAALGDIRSGDVLQVFEPQVHVSGFIATFAALAAGATSVVYDGFDPLTYARALREHRPSLICTHIDVLAELLRQPGVHRDWFDSLRGVYTGGDTVPVALQRRFREVSGLPIGVGYGMTEAIWLTVYRDGDTDRDGCIGRPVGGARLRVDEATGELLVAGPMVMQRYWDDDALTAATLADGWLRTGDRARRDAAGVWWFTGRLKDIIVRRTSKITPGEVEAVLQRHPQVAMAAVVGLPDPQEGQVPVAFVVPTSGAAPSPDELAAFLHGRIADYKIPARLHLRSALPLTSSGKISRGDLTENL
ncbi:class I adenylate-forming enzyme family protein [Mycobacterium sp. IDR2000157661]|uniref:class I adenylate-forming enzyme family protein n=1 Tax=Mycobacterium sp. IDR2000157661 TaxID=2867005 RepID=UPI001EEDDFAF|nr:class I adenylate-forming enzyme family protein [Mycobacterium sp. IDR2000157661]ULE35279.1 acyl--CoA ligase [Mycobacterium sp. IDR2000157661]